VDDDAKSVVQVMVAPVVVTLDTAILVIVGAGVDVRSVLLPDVDDWLAAFAEMTAKS
jgi:hypothetical protein